MRNDSSSYSDGIKDWKTSNEVAANRENPSLQYRYMLRKSLTT